MKPLGIASCLAVPGDRHPGRRRLAELARAAGVGRVHGNGLPERWGATENVAWKARLAGVGVSSPIVAGDHVYVTSQVGSGYVSLAPTRGWRRGPARLVRRAGPDRGAERREGLFRRPGVLADGRPARVGAPDGGGRRAPRRARQAQHGLVEPGERRAHGLCVVRHRSDRGAGPGRQGGVEPAPGPGDLALRHRLGAQQLANTARRPAAAPLRSRPRVLPARCQQGNWQAGVASRSRQGAHVVQHSLRRGQRRPQRDRRQFERTRGCLRCPRRSALVARGRHQSVSDSGRFVPERRRST